MKQVPSMLSTKDLSYIADAFEWNITASKKALAHSKKVADKEIKKNLEKTSQIYAKICQELVGLLK